MSKFIDQFVSHWAAAVMAGVLLSACAQQTSQPEVAPGLVEVDHHHYFDRVFLAPGRQLPKIRRIYIEEANVSMNDHWLKNYRGDYTERDLQRIKTSYGQLLKKTLEKQITQHDGLTLAENAAEADVIFRPALESLNIYAPDLSMPARMEHYIQEAGNATFNLQLIDPQSGATVAQILDHRETFSNPAGFRERSNRATNARYFSKLMNHWAQNLMSYLTDTDAIARVH